MPKRSSVHSRAMLRHSMIFFFSQLPFAFVLSRNHFRLSSQPLSTAAVRKLCLGKLEHLQQLSLPACQLVVKSLAALKCGFWSGPKQLNLSKHDLDQSAMAELIARPMRHLQYLDLSGNNMGLRALYEMAKGIWSYLRVLNWSSNVLSVSAVVKLSEKRPTAELHLSNCFDAQHKQCTPKPYKIQLCKSRNWISRKQEVLWCQKGPKILIHRSFCVCRLVPVAMLGSMQETG